MSEAPTVPSDQEVDPLELAVPVAQRVEIRFVLLEKCTTLRTPQTDTGAMKFEVSSVEFGIDKEEKSIFVKPSFRCRALKDSNDTDGEPSFLVEATFVLMYTIDSFDGLEDRNIHAFAATNALHNVWPYWREFVQSMSIRMGLSAVTAPVFRFAQH